MKSTTLLLAILMVTGILSCKKKGAEGEPEGNGNGNAGNVKEFMVGTIRNALRREPIVWKDGAMTRLPFESSQNTNAKSVAVSGNDVFILGHETNPNGFIRTSRIVIWKNDEMTPITDGSKKAAPIKMIVDNGNVYILGTETDQSEGSGTELYKYWKNGVVTPLNIRGGQASDMVVVNNDVYISGNETNANGKIVAKYWKNGVGVDITDGSKDAYGESISVEGSTIAVLFNQKNTTQFGNDLKVWKNNVVSVLNSGNFNTFGKKIILKDNAVHVLGRQLMSELSQQVVYWKDAAKKEITNGNRNGYEFDMQAVGNDVYVVFEETNADNIEVAKIAKNGVIKELSNGVDDMSPTAFTVVNGVEHVVGNSGTRAFKWKNGVESAVSLNGSVNGIFVKNN